jgi:hypothetical protein
MAVMSVMVDGLWGPEKERISVGKTMGSGKLEARGAIRLRVGVSASTGSFTSMNFWNPKRA